MVLFLTFVLSWPTNLQKLDIFVTTSISVANSIFIKATDEDEITAIVTSFKFKRSMGYDGFDMDLVKDITGYKVKTFTCTANGLFPGKVVLIYNAGDEHLHSSKILEQIFCVTKNNVLYATLWL